MLLSYLYIFHFRFVFLFVFRTPHNKTNSAPMHCTITMKPRTHNPSSLNSSNKQTTNEPTKQAGSTLLPVPWSDSLPPMLKPNWIPQPRRRWRPAWIETRSQCIRSRRRTGALWITAAVASLTTIAPCRRPAAVAIPARAPRPRRNRCPAVAPVAFCVAMQAVDREVASARRPVRISWRDWIAGIEVQIRRHATIADSHRYCCARICWSWVASRPALRCCTEGKCCVMKPSCSKSC